MSTFLTCLYGWMIEDNDHFLHALRNKLGESDLGDARIALETLKHGERFPLLVFYRYDDDVTKIIGRFV